MEHRCLLWLKPNIFLALIPFSEFSQPLNRSARLQRELLKKRRTLSLGLKAPFFRNLSPPSDASFFSKAWQRPSSTNVVERRTTGISSHVFNFAWALPSNVAKPFRFSKGILHPPAPKLEPASNERPPKSRIRNECKNVATLSQANSLSKEGELGLTRDTPRHEIVNKITVHAYREKIHFLQSTATKQYARSRDLNQRKVEKSREDIESKAKKERNSQYLCEKPFFVFLFFINKFRYYKSGQTCSLSPEELVPRRLL